ncbi:hypothetical protein BS50DRAFT_625544 [Corynespora cassiicola Philippines]|uniref:Bromo domain-containing protein n=1 Tax=Corynespora cassiicola Philippines TaxID=1448308 RepID=A0A2T2N7E5_CORCC|nr:hypothetical protein BS50DRAFT_625544 [Corynespora cassiicola Philippines]
MDAALGWRRAPGCTRDAGAAEEALESTVPRRPRDLGGPPARARACLARVGGSTGLPPALPCLACVTEQHLRLDLQRAPATKTHDRPRTLHRPPRLRVALHLAPAACHLAHLASIAACLRSPPDAHSAPSRPQQVVVLAPLPPSARRPRAPDAASAAHAHAAAAHWFRGMNTSLTAYTNLESLLLFQSLHAYGVNPQVFARISELLKSNPHITGDVRFQSGRLSPDALRNFYLSLLKDELRNEQDLDTPTQTNGDVKPSRKRKAPSPSLPSVQESLQHQHLIPKLVNKLYALYRSNITDQIRQDEQKYDRLQRELQGIERGEWDEQLKEKTNGKSQASRSPSAPRKSPVLHQKPAPTPTPNTASPQPVVKDKQTPPNAPPDGLAQPADTQKLPPPTQNGQPSVERDVKPVPGASPRKKQLAPDQTAPSPAPHPGPVSISPSPQPSRTPQPLAPPPRYPPPQPGSAAYNGPTPYAHRSPYPPQGPQSQGPTPPNVQQQHIPNQGHPPHAPSPGAQYQPQPIQPYTANGVPQYPPPGALPPQYSPTHQRFPGQHPPGPHSPGVQASTPSKGYYGYPPFPPHQTPMGQHPPQGGIMLPPFQVTPQEPSRAHQQPAPAPQYPQVSTPANNRQSATTAKPGSLPPAAAGRPAVPPAHPLITQARTAFSTPTQPRSPLSATGTPRSARTMWKPVAKTLSTPPAPRPEVEPLDDVEPLDQPKSQIRNRSTRKSRAKKGKEKETDKDSETATEPAPESEAAEDAPPEIETRQGRSRRKAPIKRNRPGSIASSQAGGSIRERSRSQSILSHTDTVGHDSESQAGRIKSERGTSVDAIDEDSVATPTMSTRRRGNLQSLAPNKRKRNAREASVEESEEQPSTPGLPRVVIAPRHFSRMCNPIMNDIGSHKHASTFTTAVKPKDAEGYYDIIRRPTDLKSIQKAIAAGAKLVAAAASDTPAGSPGGGGGVIELPLTPDNVPPKVIVNSAQLEKELMRMFVNAVMFNAGEDGVVEDARQMFETVQQSVSNWRSVERSSGRLEVEDTPVSMAEEEGPVLGSKRRKL